jgi:hypothetical protein
MPEPPVSYAYGPPPSASSSYAPSAAPTSTSPRATSLSRYQSQMRGDSMAGIVPGGGGGGGGGGDAASAPRASSYAAYPPAPSRGGPPAARAALALAPGEDYVPGIGPRKYNLGTSALPLPGDGGATGVGVSATYRTAFSGGWDSGGGGGGGAPALAQKFNAENFAPANYGGGVGGREVGSYGSYEATRDQRRRVDPSYAADLNSQIAERQARRRAEKDAEVSRDRALLSEPSNLPAGVRLSSRPSIRLASAMAPTQALSSNWDATGHAAAQQAQAQQLDAPWADPRNFASMLPSAAAPAHAPSSPQRVREMPANLDSDAMREAVRAWCGARLSVFARAKDPPVTHPPPPTLHPGYFCPPFPRALRSQGAATPSLDFA